MVPGLQRRRDHMSADLLVHFLGGGLAGITAASTTYPLDLIRTRLAAQVRTWLTTSFKQLFVAINLTAVYVSCWAPWDGGEHI